MGWLLLGWVVAAEAPAVEVPAAEVEPPVVQAPVDLMFHGYVSLGAIKSTDNNYLVRSRRGSVEFADVALNFKTDLNDELSVAMQLYTRDLGLRGNYDAKFDWFFLDWQRFDWLGFRAGRIRMPFGLYNEVADYDPGRTSILLPQSLYPASSRDYLLSLTGAELYGNVDIGPLGFLDYRAFGGTIFVDPNETSQTVLEVPYTLGGRLLWEPIVGLRLGGSILALRFDGNLPTPPTPVHIELPIVLWVASGEWTFSRFRVAAEYTRWDASIDSSDTRVVPEDEITTERYYGLASVDLLSWLHAVTYYSVIYPDVERRTGTAAFQRDFALGLRFDITDHWLFKIEGHYMQGTADLTNTLNSKTPPDERAEDWGLLLLKTTAYF